MEIKILEATGDDQVVADAARVSYDGKGRKSTDDQLIRYLMRHHHMTPFEMINVRVYVEAPIFVFRQWHRHRTFSYNEMSGRYTKFEDEFYRPIGWRKQDGKQTSHDELYDIPKADDLMNEAYRTSYICYQELLQLGIAKEQARIVLPVGMMSKMYASGNLRNWLGFLKLRLDKHAQWEIRECAKMIHDELEKKYPIIMEAWHEYHFESVTLTLAAQCEIRGDEWVGSSGEKAEVAATLAELGLDRILEINKAAEEGLEHPS